MVNRNTLWQIPTLKGFTQHLIQAVQSLYVEADIMIENRGRRSQKKSLMNQGVQQGCPLSQVLFNLYLDHVIIEWQDNDLQTSILSILLFADDEVIMIASEDSIQNLLHQLSKTASTYNLSL
jgi:hypothetical protein